MRMRKKRNLEPRLEKAASALLENPEELRGKWKETFPGYKELAVELGCGKGRFTADTAEAEPELFIAAVERVPEATVVGMERVTRRGLNNVRFLDMDAAAICRVFAPGEADRIYVNFCDPWPSLGHAKRRLTAPDYLTLYRTVLRPGGELRFKTDNAPLFDWSVEQLKRCGWDVIFETHDLHRDGIAEIMTDYEAKFHSQGVPICKCIARTPTEADLPVEIEELRPTGILCLPEVHPNGLRGVEEQALLKLAGIAANGKAMNIGWLAADGEGGFRPDWSQSSSSIEAEGIPEEDIQQMLKAGAEPERLPGGRYAVIPLSSPHFDEGWAAMMAALSDRGYTLDSIKPLILRAQRVGEEKVFSLAIPVKTPV